MEWTSTDGDRLQGVLMKPEDFDPQWEYPMVGYPGEGAMNSIVLGIRTDPLAAPRWMVEGIPVVLRGERLGYETVEGASVVDGGR